MLDDFHPLVREWFGSSFEAMTEPQARGWPAIRAGGDVLISAPTGSGKTLAAFTLALDDLVRQATAWNAARSDARRLRLAAQGA